MDKTTDAFERLATIKAAHILVVEDNDLNQEVATEMLQDAGFIVDLAENGQVALNKIWTMDYDLVLMDMQMPVMDGISATQKIRQEARFNPLPIIAMTANALQSDRENCLAAGMNDQVAKPIEPDVLWKALLKWIPSKTAPTLGADLVAHPLSQPAPLRPLIEPTIELPADIEGLDMFNGLRRVMGKKSLYLSMLRKFMIGQKSATENILIALESNSWNTAERFTHTLKGVSGNIGATHLQQLAAGLEAALKDRRPRLELDPLIERLKTELSDFIAQLEQKLPEIQANKQVTFDPHKLKVICDRLKALLIENDAEAMDVLDDNAELLSAAFPKHYQKLENSIHTFNFEAGLSALNFATDISA
jgi:two-component system sensor histidine kinase/response regulator